MSEHSQVEVDLDKPYEEDAISYTGIAYTTIGLAVVVLLSFFLMWYLQYRILQPWLDAQNEENANPLALSDEERLPSGPRLQSAPGFGVDDPKKGRISLQLREPQAEWKELQRQYKDIWENGEKGPDGKTIIALPIKEAKEKLLKDGGLKSASGADAEKTLESANSFVSGSSAGRIASEKRR